MTKNKFKSLIVILSLVMAVGVLALLYPQYASWWTARSQEQDAGSYEEIQTEASNLIVAEAREYNKNLGIHTIDEYYQQLVFPGREEMAVIEVPSVGIRLPIYHGVSNETLDKGAGHIEQTHLPVGGIGTNSAISAHTGLPSARMFDTLHDVEIGADIYITVGNEKLAYKVFDKAVVDPETGTAKIVKDPERDLLSLITCTPYAINTHRLLVSAERVDFTEDDYNHAISTGNSNTNLWWVLELVVGLGAITGLAIWMWPKSKVD